MADSDWGAESIVFQQVGGKQGPPYSNRYTIRAAPSRVSASTRNSNRCSTSSGSGGYTRSTGSTAHSGCAAKSCDVRQPGCGSTTSITDPLHNPIGGSN